MHHISIFCWIGFCIALYQDADGQVNFRNVIHAEIGGNAYYYSLNFERNFSKHLAGRVGIGVVPKTMIIPLLAGKLFGKGSHKLEVMAGLAYVYLRQQTEDIYQRHQLAGTAFMGYRFQRQEARFLFRAGWTPHVKLFDSYSPFSNHAFSHWAGIGLGYRLK